MQSLILASILFAAPVPKELSKPPEIGSGVWTILWNEHPYTATLNGNGEFNEFLGDGPKWVGMWSWDAEKRVLTVSESTTGDWYFKWSVKLDGNLIGVTCGGVAVKVSPFRAPKQMPGK